MLVCGVYAFYSFVWGKWIVTTHATRWSTKGLSISVISLGCGKFPAPSDRRWGEPTVRTSPHPQFDTTMRFRPKNERTEGVLDTRNDWVHVGVCRKVTKGPTDSTGAPQ